MIANIAIVKPVLTNIGMSLEVFQIHAVLEQHVPNILCHLFIERFFL